MTQFSGWWTTNAAGSGDQVEEYTQAHLALFAAILASCSGFEGVSPHWLNALACSDGGANTVDVASGGAVVDGKIYENDAEENVNIPSASGGGNTRIDRIVLRADWSAFTVRIHRIEGTDAADPEAPAVTQISGTTYDIKLCQVLVDTSGNVTVTDEREWAAPSTDGVTLEVDADTGELRVKDGGVDTDQLATDAVTAAKIAAGAVDTSELATDAVTNAKVADDAIDTAEIVDGAVTQVKLGSDTLRMAAIPIFSGSDGHEEIPGQTYTEPSNSGHRPFRFLFDADQLPSGASVYLVALITATQGNSPGPSGYARLYNATNSTAISGSEAITTQSNATSPAKSGNFASNLPSGEKTYSIQVKGEDDTTSETLYIFNVYLLIEW